MLIAKPTMKILIERRNYVEESEYRIYAKIII